MLFYPLKGITQVFRTPVVTTPTKGQIRGVTEPDILAYPMICVITDHITDQKISITQSNKSLPE